MPAAQAVEKLWRWMMLHLIFMTRDINITNLDPVIKFWSSSSKSTQFSKTIPISTIIIKSCEMEISISLWGWKKIKEKYNSDIIRIFQCRESYCRTNTRVRRKKLSKRSTTQRIKVMEWSLKVNSLSKVDWVNLLYDLLHTSSLFT